MILSMTGYGKSTASNGKWDVDTEVKSINSRYLEVFIKYPPVLATKEYEIREVVKSKIKRGKLNLNIQIRKSGVEDDDFSLNEEKLKDYLALIKKIKKTAKLSDKIKLDHILMSKDIFTVPLEEISEKDFEIIKSSINESLDSLIKMKKAEGSELEKDLKKRIKSISKYLTSIEEQAKSEVSEHFEKYKHR